MTCRNEIEMQSHPCFLMFVPSAASFRCLLCLRPLSVCVCLTHSSVFALLSVFPAPDVVWSFISGPGPHSTDSRISHWKAALGIDWKEEQWKRDHEWGKNIKIPNHESDKKNIKIRQYESNQLRKRYQSKKDSECNKKNMGKVKSFISDRTMYFIHYSLVNHNFIDQVEKDMKRSFSHFDKAKNWGLTSKFDFKSVHYQTESLPVRGKSRTKCWMNYLQGIRS